MLERKKKQEREKAITYSLALCKAKQRFGLARRGPLLGSTVAIILALGG